MNEYILTAILERFVLVFNTATLIVFILMCVARNCIVVDLSKNVNNYIMYNAFNT